jgi:hypothetical protein
MLRHNIVRDVAVIVTLKIVIVVSAALFVFGPDRLHLTPHAVERHLINSSSEVGQ